jgi:hypothetical protein
MSILVRDLRFFEAQITHRIRIVSFELQVNLPDLSLKETFNI